MLLETACYWMVKPQAHWAEEINTTKSASEYFLIPEPPWYRVLRGHHEASHSPFGVQLLPGRSSNRFSPSSTARLGSTPLGVVHNPNGPRQKWCYASELHGTGIFQWSMEEDFLEFLVSAITPGIFHSKKSYSSDCRFKRFMSFASIDLNIACSFCQWRGTLHIAMLQVICSNEGPR